MHRRLLICILSLVVVAAPALAGERRCLAMIAYAEAAGEGEAGMAAVMQVVRNRMADPAFPADACAVAAQEGQFQPVAMSPALAAALRDPALEAAKSLQVDTSYEQARLATAFALAAVPRAGDPTDGALYFVNPVVMDPARCPWFAALKKTKTIGSHVFLTGYGDGEARSAAAIDCKTAGSGFRRWREAWSQGVMAPGGPRVATITPTPAMLKKWRATGRLAQRQRTLRQRIGDAFSHQERAGGGP